MITRLQESRSQTSRAFPRGALPRRAALLQKEEPEQAAPKGEGAGEPGCSHSCCVPGFFFAAFQLPMFPSQPGAGAGAEDGRAAGQDCFSLEQNELCSLPKPPFFSPPAMPGREASSKPFLGEELGHPAATSLLGFRCFRVPGATPAETYPEGQAGCGFASLHAPRCALPWGHVASCTRLISLL